VLRVVEEAARTDTGRERRANEDAYLARSPVYVIADGMGGAQAGEVAARIATDAFEHGVAADSAAEEELARIAAEANRRIFEHARADTSRSGMGTTLTAALVNGDEVSIVHVGDSRAYLFRDGELRQLTRDHSLVEELRRRGQLTSEEAEEHPQRSVITRALGPEPSVEVDVHTHQARPGDVFLLCSDGLTSMVREERLRDILATSESLRAAVDASVREANQMGGRDNITVVLFRVGSEDERRPEPAGDTLTDLDARKLRKGVRRRPRPRPSRRVVVIALVLLALLGAATGGVVAAARSVYFIGQDDRGLLTIYRGFPYELPFGIDLYDRQYVSSVPARSLRPFERRRLLDHELRSRQDAADLIRELERGR
jgi:serine/threonine protein phosphatase PrpC